MSRNGEVVKTAGYTESVEDDDASSGEEESGSESEQTLTQKRPAKPQQAPPKPAPSSSEESGSETESESDEPASNAKPKPVDVPQTKSSNGTKKPAAAKRPAAEALSTPKDVKKKKTSSNGPETSEKKSNLFQRLFTDDDEIVLLQGMIDYRSKKKSGPAADLKAFHEFVRKKLHTVFSLAQVQDKIKRLKMKYKNNKNKEKEGKSRHFSKPHEQMSYDLSKLVWSDVKENGTVGNPKAMKTPNKKAVAVVGELNSDCGVAGGGSSLEEFVLKIGRDAFEAGKGIEGESEWCNLRVEELKLYLKQMEIRAAQSKLVLGLVKPR